MTGDGRIRIYVWEFPVRLAHWIYVLCILTLSATGMYMSRNVAYAFVTKQYVLGWVQFIHFVAAYIFVMSVLVRIYWSMAGNRYASMTAWLPSTRKRMRDLLYDIRCHLVLDIQATSKIGHTSLGSLVFFMLHIIFFMSIVSGFSLYAIQHDGGNWRMLAEWIQGVLSAEALKSFHKLLMYMVLMFVPVHLFMAVMSAVKIRNGLVRSIFSGYKFHQKDPGRSEAEKQ